LDQRNLNRLEYNKIVNALQECTTFAIGREIAGQIEPLIEAMEIMTKQKETTEAKTILRLEPDIPLGGMRDIRNYLRKAVIGGILEPNELLDIGGMLRAIRRLKLFFKDKSEKYPVMLELISELSIFRELEDHIEDSIDPSGEVADKASPDLRRLRNRIRDLQAAIKDKMDSIIRSGENQKYLQESIITMRDDRYVVPVRQEYRGQFPGIIHDQSASGATLFIEPMSVVEKNNELRQVMVEEKQEIIKILTKLTDKVKANSEELRTSVETVGEIDFIFAKGKLSQKMDGGEPAIMDEPKLNFIQARHPLLKEPVPINVKLGGEVGILVITGPNTGGKTVALKTVGLFVLMAQSGLHIPAETGSETGIFHQVFADIGDEQSIEQSLSTFSSHMNNIISILKDAGPKSLVLFDELGAGTDPAEGASLAMAILDYLDRKKAKAIATTHYSELKAFAFNRHGIQNASVEFDIKTLRPTYRLIIGQPGSSSAFEIAGRLGLPDEIVDTARQSLSKENIQVTDLIRELEDNRRVAEIDRIEADKTKKELQRLKIEYDKKMFQLAERRSEVMEKARIEANEVLRKARLEADGLIQEIKDAAAKGTSQQTLTEAQNARSRLRKIRYHEEEREIVAEGEAPKKVSPGQEVYLPKYNQPGCVITVPDSEGMVQVQVGAVKLTLSLTELRLQKTKVISETGASRVMSGKAQEISVEIDLRGLMVDEAMETVEKYLDDAYLAGLPKATLIHGKGTGALRKAVTELLTNHRYVKNHRLGVYGEGGIGVTIVELK
jgi:DNA mismatch repair protein MutS2